MPVLLISLLLAPLLWAGGLGAQSAEFRDRVGQALDDARPALMGHLAQSCGKHVRPGQLALVMLAAIDDGVERTDPVFERAVARLAKANCNQTYDLALRLMVVQALPDFPDRVEIAKDDLDRLLDHRDEGAFGYTKNTNQWDLSNTQYAALGLRAARAMQLSIPRSVWTGLAKEIAAQQDADGSFGYRKINSGFQGYPSMTAAGIAVLAVCRQALGERNALLAKLDDKIGRAWRYFDRKLDCIGSPSEHWCYYFLYGLERAAILCDVETIGGKSWYELGAKMLVDEQLPGGGWSGNEHGEQDGTLPRGRGSAVSTSFAVLFLRRKFQKVVGGPITPSIVTLANIGPNSKMEHVVACADELERRGKEALPDVLRALRSDIHNQRQAAAIALVRITGESFGFDPARGAEHNREVIKQAELWYLKNR
ncbi:MAG: hypothetical protein KDE27_15515 [Planctomycetes bacterium]|nr:hypothetical protein [Planctomycetota bacterium]